VLVKPSPLLRYGQSQEFRMEIFFIHKRTILFLISRLATNQPAEDSKYDSKRCFDCLETRVNTPETSQSPMPLTHSSHKCIYRDLVTQGSRNANKTLPARPPPSWERSTDHEFAPNSGCRTYQLVNRHTAFQHYLAVRCCHRHLRLFPLEVLSILC
jgi:hypothetical protein